MQPGPRLGHEMRHHIGKLLGLLPNGGQNTRIPVADIDAHQLRVEVKKAFAVGRPEVHALSVVNAERLHRLLRRPFVQAVLPSQAYNLVRREIAHMRLLFLVFPLVVLHSSSSRCRDNSHPEQKKRETGQLVAHRPECYVKDHTGGRYDEPQKTQIRCSGRTHGGDDLWEDRGEEYAIAPGLRVRQTPEHTEEDATHFTISLEPCGHTLVMPDLIRHPEGRELGTWIPTPYQVRGDVLSQERRVATQNRNLL